MIVGIDLGTTNSLVAAVRDGKPEVLRLRGGARLVPSVVSFGADGPLVGREARARKVRDAANTIFSVKRLLGRAFADVAASTGGLPYRITESANGMPCVEAGGRSATAVEISAMILRELKTSAEAALGEPITQAVLTVPAYFNDSQRQATRAAGRLAGLEIVRILNEPTAAALAYGLDRKRDGLIAVYDLGGGTFDLSVLKLHDGIFEVLSTRGDTALGGDDLDQAIAARIAAEIQARFGFDPRADIGLRAALLEASEMAKIELASAETARIRLELPGGEYERVLGVAELEELARPILERTREPCLQALRDAGLNASELSNVVLVGGPTRLPVVRQVVREIFGREPDVSLHPDEVVALGAAIQADILAGNNRDLLLLDVVPLSLGIETYGGLMSPLIKRNTRIPASAREVFTTFVDHQTGVDVHVLQGERERVADNRSLARFKLTGIAPAPAGLPRVEVTFLIDADGILDVFARDMKTGIEQSVEVRPSFGLTEAEIQGMLRDGESQAGADIAFKALVEARHEAEPILRATEKAWPDAGSLVGPTEAAVIGHRLETLRTALAGDDVELIRAESRLLDRATVRLAELRVNRVLEP